jgi:hypothetical protein
MATIAISELRPAGADLFDGSESFMMELSDDELEVTGGGTPAVLVGLAIRSSRTCAVAVGAAVGYIANS